MCDIFPVNTLSLAKPDKGRQAEAMLLQMAQTGQVCRHRFALQLWDTKVNEFKVPQMAVFKGG
jgi:hypothetical protein